MPGEKKYIIEIEGLEGAEMKDEQWWNEKHESLYDKHQKAHAFSVTAYDPLDTQENDQYLVTIPGIDGAEIKDSAWLKEKKDALYQKYPEAQVQTVRYVDYWGDKAKANEERRAELSQQLDERNARLAELGYYDDSGDEAVNNSIVSPRGYALKPVSSAMGYDMINGISYYKDPKLQEFFANDTYAENKSEIATLEREYESNPSVIEHKKWQAEQEAKRLAEKAAYAANLEAEIKKNFEEDVDPVLAARGLTDKRSVSINDVEGSSYLSDIIRGERPGASADEAEESETYMTALAFLEKAKIAREAAGKGFGAGLIDWAKEGLLTQTSQSEAETYNEIGYIFKRLENELGVLDETTLTEENLNKHLSRSEQALIKSFFEYNDAMADAQQDMSSAYKGAKQFAGSIQFILEFLLTGNIYKGAAKAATRGVERALLRWLGKSVRKQAVRAVRKVGLSKAAGAAVGFAAQTIAQPGTYEAMAEKSIEIGEDGHLHPIKNSLIALADRYIETLSEHSGDVIGKVLKAGGGLLAKGASKLFGETLFEEMGEWFADRALVQAVARTAPMLEKLGFHGLPIEVAEEFVGNAIRELSIQPGALKEMVEDDNFSTMLIGFAPLTALGGVGGMVNIAVTNKRAAKLGDELQSQLGGQFTDREIKSLQGAIMQAENADDIHNLIKPYALSIIDAQENGEISTEQGAQAIETLYQYGGFMAQNRALLFRKKAQDRQLMDAERTRLTDQYGRFWQEDGAETVEVATLKDGKRVFVLSKPTEDGSVVTLDILTGQKGKANVSDYASQEVNGEQKTMLSSFSMSGFLNGQIAFNRRTEEMTRMQNERDAQIKALQQQIVPGTRINLGTEGSPINVIARGTNARGVVVVDSTGMESTVGWDQAAYALGQPIKVETDQEKLEAEVAVRLQRLAERRMKNRQSPATSATVGAADQAAAEAAATAENQNIPLNEDGTVNEALFWSQDPEGYVKWNDEQNKDGGQDSLKQIAIAKQELFGMLNEVATGQNTSNPTMRKAAEKQVAAIADKIARLEAMEQSYADALAEETEAVKQTAATPTATMSEEQLEQMDAQYQGILGKTRVQSERVRVMQEYLDKLAENSAPIKVLTKDNYEEVMKAAGCSEADIKRVGTAIKTSAITGAAVAGFASNGVTFVMADTMADINSARITYIHERQHLLNSQNSEAVKQLAAALGNKENALSVLESFVGENGLEEYKNDPIEKLADEIICRSMEIVYSTENYSVDLQNRGLSEEAINIINTIDNGQRTDKSLSSARRSSYANLSQREDSEENGRNSEQVSGGVLDGQETGSLGSGGRGDAVGGQGEGAEVTEDGRNVVIATGRILSREEAEQDGSGPALRIAETNPEVNLSEETKQELSDKGLVMEGGAIMSEDYAALKHEAAYLTPIEKGAASDDIRFSVTTMPGWKKNYLQYKDADERIVRVLEAFADRMTANEMVNGVIAQGKHKSSKKTKDGKLVESGPLRSNISYVVTFDLDTSCPRSLQYLNYVKRIERSIGRPMTQIECIQLTEMMRMYGQQIPCVYCYAENKRQAMKQYFNNYIDARHAVLAAETDEEALKHMYGRVAEGTDPEAVLTDAAYKVFVKWRKNPKAMYNPSMRMLWNQYDQARNSILSLLDMRYSEGAVKTDSSDETIAKFVAADLGVTNKTALKAIEEIVVEWKWNTIEGRKHDDFTPVEEDDIWANENALEVWRDMTLYAKSASGAKNVNRYVPYTDELKNVDQATRDYINGMGGLRMHSTNDFRIDYVFDYFQFLADMAAAKMFGHTYSKSPEFVRIFGNSGYKINMSIAAYQDENGVIRPNVDEGFDWNEAKELRRLFPHAGTMLMATSDEQLQMALDSDWIDMCIPFHHSGLPKAVWYNMRLWTDYTTVQNERYLNNEERIAMLAEAGVEIPKRASTEAIEELFNEHFGIEVLYGKSGKRVKPHFLPGPTIVDGVDIPGHNNNHELYLELCKKYGVKPRFEGIKVKDNTPEGGGREIDITQHPRYMILIKETARTDTPQTAIQFNFDQPSEALGGKTPMDYAFEELEARAMAEADIAGGKVKDIYNSLNNDSFGIVNQFLNTIIKHKQETGVDYPMDYLTPESREWFMVQRKALEEAFKDIETIPYHRNEYDEQGNLVKGEGLERADEAEDGLRLRITPEQDKAYMDAVNAGDMETAQRMVDEAAKAAGYTIRGDHGRVSKFTIFDRNKANPEGNWGQGFYFTNNEEDAENNYASVEGPDLEAKIEREVERRVNLAEMNEEFNEDGEVDEFAIRDAVEDEFITSEPNVVHAALKMDNPFVVGHGMVEIGEDGLGHYDMQETYLTVEYETDEEGEIDYDSEPTGTLVDLVDALNEELSNYEWSRVNASEILYDNIDGMTASQFEQGARELLDTAGITDESGDYIMTSEIIRAAIERAGFDGIIDNTVNQKFGDARKYGQSMTGVNRDTRHYIAFESSQIKDTDPVTYDNNGNVIPLSERFNPEKSDIRFSIIGERGAKADKTPEGVTRYANLGVARQMESELKPDWAAKENEAALKIKVATGWERGADGKWRYETSDIQMRPIEDWLFNKKKMTLKDIVEPGILLDLYPELGDVVIVKNKSVTDNGAWYNDATNEMELPFAFMRRVHELAQTDESWQQKLGAWTQDLKESIIHETQHYIQDKEEFARGGNESIVIDPAAREIIDEYVEEMGKYARVYDALAASEKSQSYGKFLESQYNAYSKKVQDLMKQFGIGREGYEKLGGEVESRNTEKRSSMTSEARRQSLLASTEDVAREDQILIDNDFRLMENGLTMHSVPVTEEMKASVMEDQVMFRTIPITKEVQDEMNIIAATAIVDGNYLKAPNGADTNLTPEQWAMVRTKNFLNWFGDWINDPENASKVVDENGEPKVVYHGGNWRPVLEEPGKAVFKMRSGLMGRGAYFTDNFTNAADYAREKYEWENYKEVDEDFVSDNGYVTEAFLNIRNEENIREYYGETYYLATDPNQIKSATDNTGEYSEGEGDIRFRVVTDPAKIEELEKGEKIKVYRAMQLIDGKLYPPMSAKVDGKLREPIELGQWEEAEERPDLADNKGYFKLNKGNKKSVPARYNPYFHTSYTPLNDQFASAQDRPNLVTVEVEIPASEITSGYKAEKAKDAVGEVEWPAGVVQKKLTGTRTVVLSRWDKPVRIVPDSEVADVIVKMFEGKDITMPSNVVTPSLRAELEKRGVPFVETDNSGNPRKPSFVDVIKTLFTKGKDVANRLYQRSFFDVTKTPSFMKDLGLTGDRFTVRYGVIARHFGKDSSHDLTEEDWQKLPNALKKPFAITKLISREKDAHTDNGYRIYTALQNSKGEYVVVGVDVKNAGRDIEVNAIATVFGRRENAHLSLDEEVIYKSKKITPEQSSLLERPNSSQYPTEQELSEGKDSDNIDTTNDSDENISLRVTETPTAEVVANGLQLTSAQSAKIAGDIFAALPEESRKKITEGLGSIFDMKDAIMQIPASLASKENWNEEDVKVANVVRAAMQDAMDENAATSRPLTTKEALWMLYNVISPETDIFTSAQKAIVAHRLGFDPASMQRRQRTDDHIRFSIASQGPIDAAVDMYNYETSLWTERLKESWLDMNQSVVSLQRAMEAASGMPIEPWENTEYALNRLSSKSYADKKKYLRDYLMPLWDEVLYIVKKHHVSIDDIERYMMLKHGLERNKVFAQRDAKAFYRDMFEVVAERMKNQSHAEQVVALSEANKALADIRAKMANAQGKKLADLQEAEKRAIVDVEIANLVLRGDEQQNEADLQAHYNAIDNEADAKYKEFRDKDYGGLTSMFVDTTDVKRSDYLSEEAYQRAVQAATTQRYNSVADMEAAAVAEVDYFESATDVSYLWASVRAATRETLRHQFASGMITQEQYDSVRAMFDYYVPLRGFADNTAEDMYSYYMNNSAGGFAKPLINAKGRKTRAESPLGWIGTMAESAIQADNKNMAKMTLYYAALRRPDLGVLSITETWFEYTGQKDANGKKIFKAAYPPAVDRVLTADELRQHMEDWENDMKQKQSRGEAYKGSQRVNLQGSVVFQDAKEDQEHAVRVKVAGQDYSILINGNPRAAQAINGLLNPDANVGPVMEWVNGLKRNLSALLTSYSPLFWVSNYQRDFLSSTMRTSEASGWGAAGKYLANRRHAWAVLSYINKYEDGRLGNSYYEDLYREFAENGGITGYTSLTSNKEYEKLLEKYANSVDKKLLNGIKNVWDKFMGIGEGIEQVTRFAAYITAREEGKPIEEAISAAKEVSVNFNRKGSAKPISLDELDKLRTKDGKKLNAAQRTAAIVLSAMPGPMKMAYYFMNASIQSLSSSAKLAKKSPGKASTWVGFYMGLSVGLAMLNYLLSGDDDDEYLNLPDYLRHSTAMFKVADGYYVKWSIPQEMRPFYAWADILVRKMMDKMPHKSGWEVGKEMALAAAQWLPLNPFESEDPLLSLVPDFLSPAAEIVANTNAFGGKIYDDMAFKSEGVVKEIPAYRKATEKTGKVYVDVAKFLNDVSGGDEVVKGSININPAIVEHLVEGFGGGIYDFAKMMISLPSLILSDEPMQVKDIPFVNKVVLSVDETNMYSHTNEAFYYYKDIADNAKRVEAEYRKSDDPSRADAYRQEEDWRIYMLYKQYETDFKAVKEKLEKAVDNEEEALLKQEQNVLREMFLNDIATGKDLDPIFAMKEGLKERDKRAREAMKPYNDAEKLRKERKKLQDLDGTIAAAEKRDSIKQTPQYQRAKAEREAIKEFNKRIDSLGLMPSRAQRDSLRNEILNDYEEFKANE